MLEMLLGFGSLRLENLNIDLKLVGLDSKGDTVFEKSLQLYGSEAIMEFVKNYIEPNWIPILSKVGLTDKYSETKSLICINIKTFVKR